MPYVLYDSTTMVIQSITPKPPTKIPAGHALSVVSEVASLLSVATKNPGNYAFQSGAIVALPTGSLFKSNDRYGQVTNIAIDSTGVKTAVVTYANIGLSEYANSTDYVALTLADLTATDAVIGGVWTSGESANGFTINVKVTTASVTGGAKASVNWHSNGH